jgi:hypothetical protein
LEELRILYGLQEEIVLGDEEELRKTIVIGELEKAIVLEKISWRQKFRALWLKEDDKWTKFFYRAANLNRRNNSIESLSVKGKYLLINR